MINPKQLRILVIRPALQGIGMYSLEAEDLLMATAAQESNLGEFIVQLCGPAMSIYQIEPVTFTDLWDYVVKKGLHDTILKFCNFKNYPHAEEMIYNLRFASIMARIFYSRFPDKLPDVGDCDGLWEIYKKRWNTESGKAKKYDFINNYNKYVKLRS